MKIDTILVCDDKWGIARKGTLPFNLKKESVHFYKFISDTSFLPPGRRNVLIMGRKTWTEETPANAPHPRSVTYNFLLSKSLKDKPKEVDGIVASIEDFVALMQSPEWKDKIGRIFNIGGGTTTEYIYQTKYCGRAYMSKVKGDFQCDTFCPNFDEDMTFRKVGKTFPYEGNIPDGIQTEDSGAEWMVHIYEKNHAVS